MNVPEDDEEAKSHFDYVIKLFEQTAMLIAQASSKVLEKRRQNVLGTLIDNQSKVAELLKTNSKMIGPEETELFGPKFEEHLIKSSATKKKSVEVFSGLKKPSSSTVSRPQQRPFRWGPLSFQQGGRGQQTFRPFYTRGSSRGGKNIKFSNSRKINEINSNFVVEGFSKCASSCSEIIPKLFIPNEGLTGREAKVFSSSLENIDKRSANITGCSRFQNSLFLQSSSEISPKVKSDTGTVCSSRYRNYGDAPERGYTKGTSNRGTGSKFSTEKCCSV